MKKITKVRFALILLAGMAFLSSCGGGESAYWEGDATSEEEKMAKNTCECLYNTWKEKGIEVDKLAENMGAMAKDNSTMKPDEFEKKHADLLTELKKAQAIDPAATECGKKVSEEAGKLDEKASMKYHNAMVNKCKLTRM